MTRIVGMRRRNLRKVALLSLCSMGLLGGCSNTIHKPRSATFDGDVLLSGEVKDFFSRHRVVTLNGHDLYDGQRVEVRDRRIKCRLRDCKLQPGQHAVDIEYFWSSLEAEKKKRRSDNWKALGLILGMFAGTGGEGPNSRYYPCHVSISFEVQSAHAYLLNIVHTDQTKGPEEFQIVETASSAVVGSSSPSC